MSMMLDQIRTNETAQAPSPASARAPRPVLWGAGLAIGVLVAGAIYLMIVRGEVMMLDLSAFKMLCF